MESFLSTFSLFNNSFIVNALIAIVLISIISGVIGSLLVSSKSVFIGGGVAHCAYGGIGIAIFFGFSTVIGAAGAAIIVALLLSFVKQKNETFLDTFSTILWAFGMAVGVIFMDLTPSFNANLESYLFGSIIAINTDLFTPIIIFDVILLIFVGVYYREILSVSYDSEFCKLLGLKTKLFYNIIFILIAIGIIFSMQISGLILVLAMLSIPAYSATLVVKSLGMQMLLASILSLVFMCVGLFFSYKLNISSGASTVMCALVFMVIALIIKKLALKKRF
ncbi:metal ABC transporter permease [Helicobacter sp. 11S02629-2]|uniref:metal ABC transporter permease n=1 Tax=Helicobacter sp. 11S02629-2 TaxID=1476195 RepID=UPI000BA5FD27|nr:metal ABC transporter permease [Helicobacter sp. 11S02629-2]PAF41792.1 hypothetical protein BKH40_08260 [Helicobacter sp. 11S02629-2]